jgi:hypothetical protein
LYIECVTVVVDADNAGHRGADELASRLNQRAFQVEFWG